MKPSTTTIVAGSDQFIFKEIIEADRASGVLIHGIDIDK